MKTGKHASHVYLSGWCSNFEGPPSCRPLVALQLLWLRLHFVSPELQSTPGTKQIFGCTPLLKCTSAVVASFAIFVSPELQSTPGTRQMFWLHSAAEVWIYVRELEIL